MGEGEANGRVPENGSSKHGMEEEDSTEQGRRNTADDSTNRNRTITGITMIFIFLVMLDSCTSGMALKV